MNISAVEKIANAVLYEGYLLYPYRLDSVKNRQRWSFGTLYPPAATAETGPSSFHAEVLVRSNVPSDVLGSGQTSLGTPVLETMLRFLQFTSAGGEAPWNEVPWNEVLERRVELPEARLGELGGGIERSFSFPPEQIEIRGKPGYTRKLEGTIRLSATAVFAGAFRLALEVTNPSACPASTREEALLHSFASAHAILRLRGGEFVSLLEPAAGLAEAAAECRNTGVFPVLCGEAPAADTMLVSPIILYDYPQIAPESSGDFFDGTEIDEMLLLRVMTLSEEEKQQVAAGDPRGRSILERASGIGAEQLMKVHGAIRGLRRVTGEG